MTDKPAASYSSMLRNLLAVIHRDGGHYIWQHGTEKAYEDGMQIVAAAPASSQVTPVAEPCPCCNGSGKVLVTSFQDSSKKIENTCHICKGKGTLYASPVAAGTTDGWTLEEVHTAISRALDEANVKNETLRGMCIVAGLETLPVCTYAPYYEDDLP